VNEPQFNDNDWSILKSNDPTALLQTVPFRSLELDHCQRFRELYLGLKLKLASDGTGRALGSILV
jgi:hypothetical protein